MRSLLLLLLAILLFFSFSTPSYAECTFVRNNAADQGVVVKPNRRGDCVIKWKSWKSHAFSEGVHVYEIHRGYVYYVATGTVTDVAMDVPRRQEFVGWGDILEPFDNVWFPPLIVESARGFLF